MAHGEQRRSRHRRSIRVLGGTLAVLLTGGLGVGVTYAMANLEDLKAQVPRLDGQDVRSPIEQSADDAVEYAQEITKPRESDGNGPGFALSAEPPPGVDVGPGRWCPADVIGYRIDATAARAAGSTMAKERQRWRDAFAQWTRASGGKYRFVYRGTAEYPVQEGRDSFPIEPTRVPEGEIAITYAFPHRDPQRLARYVHHRLDDTLGFAGLGPIDWRPGPGQGMITRAMIVLDAPDSVVDPHAVPTPYIHESGHALGLAHVEDDGQMMAVDAGSTSVINDGDRAGLARLVRLGCA